MIRVCGDLCCVRCVFYLVWCSLTYEHREEENGHRDVEDRTGDVKEPVRSHREETEEKEEEEQTATVFLHLTGEGRRKTGEKRTKMVRRNEGKLDETRKRMKKLLLFLSQSCWHGEWRRLPSSAAGPLYQGRAEPHAASQTQRRAGSRTWSPSW